MSMRVASLIPGCTDRYTEESESEAWHARLERSLGFGSYKGTRNRAAIDLGRFIHEAHRKQDQVANDGALGHSSILRESERTNEGN